MKKKPARDNTPLNEHPQWLVNWFDDFGTPDNHYRFLSNFYVGKPLVCDGEEYRTGEHLFQALKAITPRDEAKVRNAPTPGEAKRIGRRIMLRPDWEAVKYDVMAMVVRLKFARDRQEAQLLEMTGNALLMEGTFWGDTVWGVDLNKDGWPGRNWLGTLLMARRAELRADLNDGVVNMGLRAYDAHIIKSADDFQVECFDNAMDEGAE